MKLMVARRQTDYRGDYTANYVLNPEWMCAPYELIQVAEILGHPPTVGPYRFSHKNIDQVERYCLDQNWEELSKLAVPELIPPV